MIRYYGDPPYRAAVIHGGPGAPGSAAGLAAMAGEICGVSEPMQSGKSIRELIFELKGQLEEAGNVPVILIGHSWGAFLAALFAGAHPEMVEKLILVGCPPLTAGYVPMIGERRRRNLGPGEREEFDRLNLWLEQGTPERGRMEEPGMPEQPERSREHADRLLARLGELAENGDCYDPLPCAADHEMLTDAEQYRAVWGEAVKLRASGQLLRSFVALDCPITLIQGEQDPHPVCGVCGPLAGSGKEYRVHVLKCCGHSPWLERRAQAEFFEILKQELGQ